MELVKLLGTFLAGYATIIVLDFIWLGNVINGFIAKSFEGLVAIENGEMKLNLAAWFFTWAIIVVLVYVFILKSGFATSYKSAAIYGWILGALVYAIYDFTNLTFLKGYSFQFAMVDIAWGTFLLAVVSMIMFGVDRYLTKIL